MSLRTAFACAALLATSAFLFVHAGSDATAFEETSFAERTARARTAREAEGPQVTYVVEQDGLRYEYHAVMGTETLWRTADGPDGRASLAAERPADVERMRRSLVERCGVRDLEALRAPHREAIESLRKLGYL